MTMCYYYTKVKIWLRMYTREQITWLSKVEEFLGPGFIRFHGHVRNRRMHPSFEFEGSNLSHYFRHTLSPRHPIPSILPSIAMFGIMIIA